MIKNAIKNHPLVLICVTFSFVLFILFLAFKSQAYNFMDLEIKWLIVAGIPILFALIFGGYVKSFKGFGIELEANLKDTLPSALIISFDSLVENSYVIRKESVSRLNNLARLRKDKTTRVRFILGFDEYYDTYAIMHYFESLRNLSFIEIVNEKNQFLYLIPISDFKSQNAFSDDQISQLITALARKEILTYFPGAIDDAVEVNDSIIGAYKKIIESYKSSGRETRSYYLPVVNDKKIMVGVVYRQKLEAKIAEEVVKKI